MQTFLIEPDHIINLHVIRSLLSCNEILWYVDFLFEKVTQDDYVTISWKYRMGLIVGGGVGITTTNSIGTVMGKK